MLSIIIDNFSSDSLHFITIVDAFRVTAPIY